jgi:microcompartment protein CcmL/EutN
MQALGLIETRGFLASIECADVMLKAAQVKLVGKTFVGGGLVTIAVTGDVGAVKAAVEAGASAVEQIDRMSLISRHVIPRPHHELEGIVVTSPNPPRNKQALACPKKDEGMPSVSELQPDVEGNIPNQTEAATEAAVKTKGEGMTEATAEIITEAITETVEKTVGESEKEAVDFGKIASGSLHKDRIHEIIRQSGIENGIKLLRTIPVVKLRNLAREYKDFGIAGRAVSKAGKELLIKKFQEYYERNAKQANQQKP